MSLNLNNYHYYQSMPKHNTFLDNMPNNLNRMSNQPNQNRENSLNNPRGNNSKFIDIITLNNNAPIQRNVTINRNNYSNLYKDVQNNSNLSRDVNNSLFQSKLQTLIMTQDKAKEPAENNFKKNLRKNIILNDQRSPNDIKAQAQAQGHSYNNLDQLKAGLTAQPPSKIEKLFSSYNNSALVNQLPPSNYNATANFPDRDKGLKIANFQGVSQNQHNHITEKCFSLLNAISVKEFSYREDQNIQYRQQMEDFCKIIDKFTGDSTKGFFSLYDGHGGSDIVKYCKDRMPDIFSKNLQSNTNIDKALISSFEKLDNETKLLDSENTGSTACIVYICKEPDTYDKKTLKRVIYVANIGDTRCLMISKNSQKRLSTDHRCEDNSEVLRIKQAGGVIFDNRVYGQLMLTRAFGDHSLKKYGVISTPSITRHVIQEDNLYLILASDGIWDTIDDEFAYRMSKNISSSEEYCKLMLKSALSTGSKDNASCLIIKLN